MLYVQPYKTRDSKFAKSGTLIFNIIQKDHQLSQVENLMFVSAPVLAQPLPALTLKPLAAKNQLFSDESFTEVDD